MSDIVTNGMTESSPSFDLAGQKRRREQLHAWCREANRPRYDQEGRWIASENGGATWRERESHSYAFYAGDKADMALANTILAAVPDDLNDFSGGHAAKLLGLHEDKMSRAVREKLVSALGIVTEHSSRHLFRYTENCGLLNVLGLLEANRRFNRPHYLDRARRFLEVFCRFLETGNVCKEYLSVNYHIVTITGAAYLRQLSPDPDCGVLAARIEARLWDELAMLWHPRLFLSGAASGRSYTPNSIPVASGLNLAAWIAYGDAATPSPEALGLFAKPGTPEARASGCPAHDLPFWQACIAWSAAPEYHPSEEQRRQTVDKAFPFEMSAKTEVPAFREHEILPVSKEECYKLGGWWGGGAGDQGNAYVPSTILRPGGPVLLSTHMTPDWGLGTATRQMLGSSNACFASWRRMPSVTTLADTRTLFMRYVINDKLEKAFTEQEQGNVEDDGRGGAAQSGPLGLAWYAGDEKTTEGIARLRTCTIFPLWHGNDVDELWIGDRACPAREGVSSQPDWVFIRDGDVYIGLRPLLTVIHGAPPNIVEVKRVGLFRVVTFANGDGPPREFRAAALRQTGGGTLVCMGSRAEQGAFAEFRASCASVAVEDEVYQSQRRLRAVWNRREVELLWDMQTAALLWLRTEKGYIWP